MDDEDLHDNDALRGIRKSIEWLSSARDAYNQDRDDETPHQARPGLFSFPLPFAFPFPLHEEGLTTDGTDVCKKKKRCHLLGGE